MDKESLKHLKESWEAAEEQRQVAEFKTKVFTLILFLSVIIIIGLKFNTISLYAWGGIWGLIILIAVMWSDVYYHNKRAETIYEIFLEMELENDKKN